MRGLIIICCLVACDSVQPATDAASPQTCLDVGWHAMQGPLALSNTTRLSGWVWSGCEGDATVTVDLDGAQIEPCDHPSLADDQRMSWQVTDLDGHGRWQATINTWCLLNNGVDLSGLHRLTVRSFDAGGLPIHQATIDVTFGAPDRVDALPWTPGISLAKGSEPANRSGATRTSTHTVTVQTADGEGTYAYQVAVPTGYDPAEPTPVLISLHPWGGDNAWRTFANVTGLHEPVAQRGWLHVVPQGNHHDPSLSTQSACYEGECRPSFGCLVDQCHADENWYTPVLHAISADIVSRYTISPEQVYVVGQGCGGSYALCLAVEHGDRVAAVTVVDGDPSPIKQMLTDPSGAGIPIDRPGPTKLMVVSGATGDAWKPMGPNGELGAPWCMQSEWVQGGVAARWYREHNAALLAYLAQHRSQ